MSETYEEELLERVRVLEGDLEIALKEHANLERQFAEWQSVTEVRHSLALAETKIEHLERQAVRMQVNAALGEACREIYSRSRFPWWEISRRLTTVVGVDRFTGYGEECQKP